MILYKNRFIFDDSVPGRDTHWRVRGLVFDPDQSAAEVKRLECADIICTSRDEASEYALTLCKAWVDGLRVERKVRH